MSKTNLERKLTRLHTVRACRASFSCGDWILWERRRTATWGLRAQSHDLWSQERLFLSRQCRRNCCVWASKCRLHTGSEVTGDWLKPRPGILVPLHCLAHFGACVSLSHFDTRNWQTEICLHLSFEGILFSITAKTLARHTSPPSDGLSLWGDRQLSPSPQKFRQTANGTGRPLKKIYDSNIAIIFYILYFKKLSRRWSGGGRLCREEICTITAAKSWKKKLLVQEDKALY